MRTNTSSLLVALSPRNATARTVESVLQLPFHVAVHYGRGLIVASKPAVDTLLVAVAIVYSLIAYLVNHVVAELVSCVEGDYGMHAIGISPVVLPVLEYYDARNHALLTGDDGDYEVVTPLSPMYSSDDLGDDGHYDIVISASPYLPCPVAYVEVDEFEPVPPPLPMCMHDVQRLQSFLTAPLLSTTADTLLGDLSVAILERSKVKFGKGTTQPEEAEEARIAKCLAGMQTVRSETKAERNALIRLAVTVHGVATKTVAVEYGLSMRTVQQIVKASK